MRKQVFSLSETHLLQITTKQLFIMAVHTPLICSEKEMCHDNCKRKFLQTCIYLKFKISMTAENVKKSATAVSKRCSDKPRFVQLHPQKGKKKEKKWILWKYQKEIKSGFQKTNIILVLRWAKWMTTRSKVLLRKPPHSMYISRRRNKQKK